MDTFLDSSMIGAPIPKYECVMRRCPNPRAIAIDVATLEARGWVEKLFCYSASADPMWRRLPERVVLVVSECYDFEEVFTFASGNPMVHVAEAIVPVVEVTGFVTP